MALIELKKIRKTYDLGEIEVHALRDATLDIDRGEYVTLIGPSGSGKSTLVDLIPRFHDPTSGRVTLDVLLARPADFRGLATNTLQRYIQPDGTRHMAAINIGRRPTFYEHADSSLLEAHLLDFDGELYGEPARVRFIGFLRSERKFDGIDALVAQLKQDIDRAHELLADR